MATIIRIGDQYVNLDSVLSISFIRDSEVCIHLIDGTPQYISCYDLDEIREILDALADRTKRECEEK
jgi:hypothetical protein